MFTHDQTGRLTSPQPDLQKTVCGSCAVCKIHLKSCAEPKLLPCLHTVCHACLSTICKDESTYECPLCTQSCWLVEITDCLVFEDASDNNKDLKCAACEETEVDGWCVQCEEALCLDCVSAHRRVKVTRDHEVIGNKPPTGWMPRRRCPSHKQESLRFFCLVCEELTCKDCQLITHKGHSFVQQEEAVGSQRQQLLSLLETIRKQKETVSTSLLLLEARLNDIKEVKSQTSKTLTQVVHSVYHYLLLRARQILKELEGLCAEEVKGLLERKTFLNRMEDFQDYIVAFIDKILSAESHCLLVHKKRIDNQVKKLLSQNPCPPETMFELQLQLQKDLYQNITNCELMRVRKVTVPFTSKTGSIWAKSGKLSNPPSDRASAKVHPLLPSSSSDQSTEVIPGQFQHRQSDGASSNCVPNVSSLKTPLNLPPCVNSQPCPPDEKPASMINNISLSGKPRMTWNMEPGTNYYLTSSQSPAQTPLVPASSQTTRHPKPKSTYKTPRITHRVQANNHTAIYQHPLPVQHSLPVVPADTQKPILAQVIPANNQTPAFPQPILKQNQPPILTHPMPANNQTAVLAHPIPAIPPNNHTTILTLPIPANNQTPILNHPVSSKPTDTHMLILAHPLQASVLEAMHTSAVQPDMALTVPSTINTLSVNVIPAVNSDHCTEAPKMGKGSQSHDSSAVNPTSPTMTTKPNPANGSSLPDNSKNSAHHRTNLSIKALADSACDQEASVRSTGFTNTDNPENNLPTSTVSETDSEEPLPTTGQDPACSAVPSTITHNLFSSTTTVKRSRGQRSPLKGDQVQADHSSSECHSEPKHRSVGMATSFHQLVTGTYMPDCLRDNLNDTTPVDSVSCSVSESLTLLTSEKMTTTHDKTVQSDFDKDTKEEDEESAVTLKHKQHLKRVLRVTLVRLPIPLSSFGQPLPRFYLTKDASTDHVLVQETQGGQIKQVWRWKEDPVPSSSRSVSRNSNSHLSSEVQFCTVCQSAGATLLCCKCGRAFHSDCHIPPVFVKLCDEWVCLLCMNVNDEVITYGSEQKRSLSLQDQRKCEKLLLSLVCDENRCLLYIVKRHLEVSEFDIILGRLLGKQKPPYRTAAELVSDVWTIFDILSTNSERRDIVYKLQKSFQQQLNESFGKSLHPSLLRPSSNKASSDSPGNQKEKHRKTLKRMREFFTTNCGTLAKKPRTGRGKEREDSGKSVDGP